MPYRILSYPTADCDPYTGKAHCETGRSLVKTKAHAEALVNGLGRWLVLQETGGYNTVATKAPGQPWVDVPWRTRVEND